jgi:hypothetical protein
MGCQLWRLVSTGRVADVMDFSSAQLLRCFNSVITEAILDKNEK